MATEGPWALGPGPGPQAPGPGPRPGRWVMCPLGAIPSISKGIPQEKFNLLPTFNPHVFFGISEKSTTNLCFELARAGEAQLGPTKNVQSDLGILELQGAKVPNMGSQILIFSTKNKTKNKRLVKAGWLQRPKHGWIQAELALTWAIYTEVWFSEF